MILHPNVISVMLSSQTPITNKYFMDVDLAFLSLSLFFYLVLDLESSEWYVK